MKKARKLLASLLALALLGGLLACGTDAPSESTGGTAEPDTSVAETGTDDDDDGAAADSDYAERLKITIANVAPIEGYDYTAGDPYAKFWTDKYNMDVEAVGFTWDNWDEMLRIWVNSGDMPDVAVFQYRTQTHPDAASWADQGLIKQMPDDWRERWPNAAAVFDKTSLGPQMEETFGGVYFLPRARFDVNLPGDPLPNHLNFYLRADWAEEVGFELKDAYTISEIVEYAQLVKDNDPAGLGQSLVPLSLRPEYAARLFVGHNSTYWNSFYKDANGEYQWGAASDDTLEGLKLFYQAYEAGLLPEFYTLMNEEDQDAFYYSGTAAGAYFDGTSTGLQVNLLSRFQESVELDPTEVVHAATVLGEDGKYHQMDLINYWCAIIFSPDIDDEVFERYMDWMDYGVTEEGFLYQVAGFEGEDYEIVDGEMVNLLPEGMPLETANGKYPSIGGYWLGNLKLWDDFSFDNPNVVPFYRDLSKKMYDTKVQYGDNDTLAPTDWTVWMHDSPARRQIAYDYGKEFSNLVTNSTSVADLEANWRAWVDSQMGMVQPVLDELNEY